MNYSKRLILIFTDTFFYQVVMFFFNTQSHPTRSLRQIIILSVLALSLNVAAQSSSPGEKRFSFAEGTLGFDAQFMPMSGSTSYLDQDGVVQSSPFSTALTPRFIISGTHFWGHADFYITLPIVNLLNNDNQDLGTYYNTGSETGAKIYPWRIKENRLAPYLGVSWNLMRFVQNDIHEQENSFLRSQAHLHTGLTYRKNDKLFDFNVSYNPSTEQDFYLSRTVKSQVDLPALSFSLGYRWTFDSSMPDKEAYDNGTLGAIARELREKGKASDFSFSVGLSAAMVGGADYSERNHPFSDEFSLTNSHLDLGIGYFFDRWDAHANISYRQMSYNARSYGLDQKLRRRTIGLELYKFLFDYHGFVPYIGLIPSFEKYVFDQVDSETSRNLVDVTKYNTGLIFGWDIRQDDVQWYILRTNLRYFPNRLSIEGQEYKFNQFEFNFIQFVYYPGRHRWIRKLKKARQ